MAKRLREPILQARAALEYGAAFVVAHVDVDLVELLRDALAALPEHEVAWRCRVQARLAAALQPHPEPEIPIAMAMEAVERARSLHDPEVLLSVTRSAASALMDLAAAEQRVALNREHVALAMRLEQPAETFRGQMRLVFDHYEMQDMIAARAAVEACTTIAEQLEHPSFLWRAEAFRALIAAWEGRFDAAAEHNLRAAEVAKLAGDVNARRTLPLQRFEHLRLQGRGDEARAALAQLEDVRAGQMGALFVDVLQAVLTPRQSLLTPEQIDTCIGFNDMTFLQLLAERAWLTRDEALASRIEHRLESRRMALAHGGVYAMTWDAPVLRGLALINRTMGRWDEARTHHDAALDVAKRIGARAHQAWLALEAAEVRTAQGMALANQPNKVYALLDEAEALAVELEMPDVRVRVKALRSEGATQAPRKPISKGERSLDLRLRLEGEVWHLSWGEGSASLLKDSKGMRILAKLVETPGRPWFVLDLLEAEGVIDLGDAGEHLDSEARRAYGARLQSLNEEIEEAEFQNDLHRAATLREERDFIARELGRAVGLGGRARRSGAQVERARVNVQRRLKDAVRRIAELNGPLGRRLERSLTTGTVCRYEPD